MTDYKNPSFKDWKQPASQLAASRGAKGGIQLEPCRVTREHLGDLFARGGDGKQTTDRKKKMKTRKQTKRFTAVLP